MPFEFSPFARHMERVRKTALLLQPTLLSPWQYYTLAALDAGCYSPTVQRVLMCTSPDDLDMSIVALRRRHLVGGREKCSHCPYYPVKTCSNSLELTGAGRALALINFAFAVAFAIGFLLWFCQGGAR